MPKKLKTPILLEELISQSQANIAKLEERLKQERFKLNDYRNQKYSMEMKALESAMNAKGLTVTDMIDLINGQEQ